MSMRTRTPLRRFPRSLPSTTSRSGQTGRADHMGHRRDSRPVAPIPKRLVLLTGLFLAGILIGTIFAGRVSSEIAGQMSDLLTGFASKRREQSIVGIFLSSFGGAAVLLLMLFFSGFCAIAQPIPALLLLFRGTGYGFSTAYLYLTVGSEGIAYICAVLLPDIFFTTIVLVMASNESLGLSVDFFQRIQENPSGNLRRVIQQYCVRFFGYAVLLFFITLADACVSYIYLKNASAAFLSVLGS